MKIQSYIKKYEDNKGRFEIFLEIMLNYFVDQ